VLWIIVPQAKTASQKLAMRGEATNLESLEKFFETKSKKKINKTLIGKALSLPVILIDFVMRFLRKVFPVLRVLLGMITTFFASVFIFALVTLFLGILNG
jgi:hypothetical protein